MSSDKDTEGARLRAKAIAVELRQSLLSRHDLGNGHPEGLQPWVEVDIFDAKGLRRIDGGAPRSFGLKSFIAKALLSFVGVAALAATAHVVSFSVE